MADKQKMEEYRRQIEERVAEEERLEEDLVGDKSAPLPAAELDIAFIRKCYNANELGDSILYNTLNREKHLFNTVSKQWMTYLGPHWENDDRNQALADIEASVVLAYMRLLAENGEQIDRLEGEKDKSNVGKLKALRSKEKEITNRIDKLRTASGRAAVLKCAISNADPLTIHPDQLDQEAWLLPVLNGVVDLRTGQLRPGRPEDYFTARANVEYHGLDVSAPTFERFLFTSLGDNKPVVDFLLRAIGAGLVGEVRDRFFVVLYGQHGQNGKGKLSEILFFILAQLSSPIRAELLMSQRFTKSADGPSPAELALKGKRIVWGSETEENQSFAPGQLKRLSGGDPLIGRGVGERDQVTFLPTHTMFLLCNTLPSAPAWDSAFWERIKVVEYPYSFVQRPVKKDEGGNELPVELEKYQRLADPDILGKLKEEASGILAALVRGCLEWQRRGLDPPQKVIDDSLKYRRHEDDIQEFVDQCCELGAGPEYKTPFKQLYDKYRAWWEEVSTTRAMPMKKFGTLLSLKFEKTKASVILYHGLRIRIEAGKWGEEQ